MVVFGGAGVLVVLLFVAGMALAGQGVDPAPGDRVAVAADEEGSVVVAAGRCRDERVTMVALLSEAGEPLWRIRSRKGSIDRRYVVGGPPPLGFEEEVALERPPAAGDAVLTAVVEIDHEVTDQRPFRTADLEPSGEAACVETADDLVGATRLFAVGALGVVASYAVLVSRWWRGRRPPPRRR